MQDLFSTDRLAAVDPKKVRETYDDWPTLARTGFNVGVDLPSKKFTKLYVLGMGGSAAGGDIIAGWLSERPGLEMAVFKGQLPIGDLSDSVTIACSASGKTEETIQMLRTAVQRKATAISISEGGKLKEVSMELGVPNIKMPKFLAPRYVFPFILFSTLAIVNKAMDLRCEAEAEAAFGALAAEGKEVTIGVPESANPAKRLALSIYQKVPVIYGSRLTRGAGIRFKNSLNENAKKHSYYESIPDAFHNDIETWEDSSTNFVPIFLRHTNEASRDRTRMDAMTRLVAQAGKGPIEVSGRGKSSLEQLVSMVYRLDLTSYYAAVALGRDPYPTTFMDQMKKA